MTKLSKVLPLALAISGALVAGSASATTSNLGTLGASVANSAFVHSQFVEGTTSFEDIIKFDIAKTSTLTSAFNNLDLALDFGVFGKFALLKIGDLTAKLWSVDPAAQAGSGAKSTVESLGTIYSQSAGKTKATASNNSFQLGAGSYWLDITGNTNGLIGGAYSVALNAIPAPVPEPETYAMLVAGLGLMGTIARRRSKKESV